MTKLWITQFTREMFSILFAIPNAFAQGVHTYIGQITSNSVTPGMAQVLINVDKAGIGGGTVRNPFVLCTWQLGTGKHPLYHVADFVTREFEKRKSTANPVQFVITTGDNISFPDNKPARYYPFNFGGLADFFASRPTPPTLFNGHKHNFQISGARGELRAGKKLLQLSQPSWHVASPGGVEFTRGGLIHAAEAGTFAISRTGVYREMDAWLSIGK